MPMGRSPLFPTPEKLQAAIDKYFTDCDKKIIIKQVVQKGVVVEVPVPTPYTVAGLAAALGTTRASILRYATGEHPTFKDPEKSREYRNIIAHAKARIEESNVTAGLIGAHDSRIAALNLASNFGYSEKSSQEDPQEARAKLLAELVQALPPDLISALRGRLMGEIAGRRKLIDITPEKEEYED